VTGRCLAVNITAMEPSGADMPSVVGMSLASARKRISALSADRQVTVQHRGNRFVPFGLVTAQQPAAGSPVAPDADVFLTVSTGSGEAPARRR
jgi:beta-lactam-binding protein with PASTA domain